MKQISSLTLLAAAALLLACGTSGNVQPVTDGGSGGCPAGRSSCQGNCVDLQSDPTNCGSCGFGCPQGTVCFTGLCLSSCGNGNTQTGEECDDGNRQSGDGCASTCQREQGFSCTGTPSVCTSRCGDGVKAPAEACDDGDNFSGDGCSATCAVETGYSCTTADPAVCTTVCGDGLIIGTEECDDQDAQGGDGCSATCTRETGWGCSGTPSVCQTVCGDGQRTANETCDDGDGFGGDGCSSSCQVESGWSCNTATPNVCITTCGDGIRAGNETCDDGNTTSGNGCSSTCNVESGWSCNTATPNVCVATCGDGVRVGNEQCDDGNTTSGNGCSASCQLESGWTCSTGTPNVCNTTCGDGIRAGAESCDDGNTTSGNGCSSSCAVELGWTCNTATPNVCAATCGDGLRRGSETCDDSNTNNNDGCSSACAVETGWTCTTAQPSVCTLQCGNGVRQGTEACDDGNTNNNDGCSSACALESGFTCNTSVNPTTCAAVCGDGQRRGTEACDDGNTTSGNGCSSTCQLESGWTCNTATPNVCTPVCGDGQRLGAEQCDDGDPFGGDGCSSSCMVEPGFTCNSASPNLCTPICGDGQVRGTEGCDDGLQNPGDGCSATCTVEYGYRCTGSPSTCTIFCGDGVVFGTEVCDDGNTVSGDCCSSMCTPEPGCEVEPNNTLSTANNFFALSVDGGSLRAFLGDSGTDVAATTDVDVFAFYLDGGNNSLVVRTGTGAYGSTCGGGGIDTKFTLKSSDGGVLSTDDDSISVYCAVVSMRGAPPGLYYVEVMVGSTGETTADYTLIATYGYCGNGVRDQGEQCEDGNAVDTDQCRNDCSYHREVENNDIADSGTPVDAGSLYGGSIIPTTDPDYYAFVVPFIADVRLETFDGTGPSSCGNGVNTIMSLYSPTVVALATDDNDGVGSCSLIQPSSDAAARQLQPGTYYVRVGAALGAAAIPDYVLKIDLTSQCGNGLREGYEECDGTASCGSNCKRVVTCGDYIIEGTEQCEDGNTTAGDGCSATCQREVTAEIEPNNSTTDATASSLQITGSKIISASIPSLGDRDYFRVTVATSTAVRFETFDSTAASCSTITTDMRLYDASGTQIYADTNGGIGSCSAIAAFLSAGTYFVSVEESGNSTTISSYHLEVKFLTDGTEAEPNDADSTASAVTKNDVYVFGGHLTNTDLDWFKVYVPAGKGVRAEIIEGDSTETCEANGIDSEIDLYSATAPTTSIVNDDDTGRGYCSKIDGTGPSAQRLDSLAGGLQAGDYLIRVKESDLADVAGGQFNYRLVITIR